MLMMVACWMCAISPSAQADAADADDAGVYKCMHCCLTKLLWRDRHRLGLIWLVDPADARDARVLIHVGLNLLMLRVLTFSASIVLPRIRATPADADAARAGMSQISGRPS